MELIIAVVGLIVGIAAGFFSGKTIANKTTETIRKDAAKEAEELRLEGMRTLETAKKDGEAAKKERLLEAKEKVLQMQAEADQKINQRRRSLEDAQQKNKQNESDLRLKLKEVKRGEEDIEQSKQTLATQLKVIEEKKKELVKKDKDFVILKGNVKKKEEELEKEKKKLKKQAEELKKEKSEIETQIVAELEKVAGLTKEEAKQQLVDEMMLKAETEALAKIKELMDQTELKANKEAKKIIIKTIQRTAAEHTIENTVSVFNLNTDDIKGQIIGREGRNIRTLEAATGVEIIVDDTPGAVVISSYDPLRREIARLSLQRLVADGRIHPARIEEVVAKTRKMLDQHIIELGERTIIDLDIHQPLHKELIRLVGRMRFRSSYGQNLLQHSKETANLCAIMATELGFSKKHAQMAKRAGLLHDIGKVSEEDPELSHALLGMKLAERHGEKPIICNAIGAHHDEIEMNNLISPIVQACDAISGARPGARREILESYLQRIKDLEELAKSYDGVEKAYAMQAGRELRVIVESDVVTDDAAEQLSFNIAYKIQSDMQYPGQIKVNVIREKRAVNYAK